ncbi:MAG: hypothetical protein Pars2KO_32160 [Parasphingorhabdus sp.]
MSNEHENTPSMMTGDTPEARAWRREQTGVDADIEGLAQNDAEDIAFDKSLDALGISHEEKIERLKTYFTNKYHDSQQSGLDAAE